MDGYAFGSHGGEPARLSRLEHEFDTISRCALSSTGLTAGWRCWEVGAGRGSIAAWLCEQAGPAGEVLATDLDISRLAVPAGPALRVSRHDLAHDPLPSGDFDLIHARFVLEHLPDPAVAVERLAGVLRPGGYLVLADAAGLSLAASPVEPALDRLAGCWADAARELGWHPDYGLDLLSDLGRAGLAGSGYSYRRHGPGGPAWQLVRNGLHRLRPQLLAGGMTEAELGRVDAVLADPRQLLTGAPTMIAIAHKSGAM